jgi:hypothetical protein
MSPRHTATPSRYTSSFRNEIIEVFFDLRDHLRSGVSMFSPIYSKDIGRYILGRRHGKPELDKSGDTRSDGRAVPGEGCGVPGEPD